MHFMHELILIRDVFMFEKGLHGDISPYPPFLKKKIFLTLLTNYLMSSIE